MTSTTAACSTRARTRVLGLLVLGAAFMAPLAANADDHHHPHHPVHHRHQVCKQVRVRDHHGHYHSTKQCHWVNR
jgi:hypothetical protein